MDHARHLSSPSPTSPFLFHHSERAYKSNPLTPLLSSTADVSSVVDDCFSTNSSSISSHQSHHNPFAIDHTTLNGHLKSQHHHRSPVDHHDLYPNQDDSALLENHTSTSTAAVQDPTSHLDVGHHQDLTGAGQTRNYGRTNQATGNIDRDSLGEVDRDDDDDDDGMHNMLSGSSTSSTSTLPLLSDSHSHHPFSRISLGEYSPLSLVDDCDNALPISPTLGSHSFKSSLVNGCLVKMDNLVGDDEDDDDGRVVVHDEDVDDDARSLSPSLLNSSQHSQHNGLWSTSSTAITQSTSLLNGSSSPYLLSSHHQHHHHHQHQHHQHQHHHNPHHHQQLSSLIQQLEPQSLDEPPPLIGEAQSGNQKGCAIFQSGSSVSPSTLSTGRPSSEPPPSLNLLDGSNNVALQFSITAMDGKLSSNLGSSSIKSSKASAQRSNNSGNKSSSLNQQNSPTRSNASNIRGTTCSNSAAMSVSAFSPTASGLNSAGDNYKTTNSRPRRSRNRSRSSSKNKQQNKSANKRCESQQSQLQSKKAENESQNQEQSPTFVHSSKLHLQLNHHKKLQELQRRLFGTSSETSAVASTLDDSETEKNQVASTIGQSAGSHHLTTIESSASQAQVKEEPDSSATDGARETSIATSSGADTSANKATRCRPSRSRASRQVKSETGTLAGSSLSLRSSSSSAKQLAAATTTSAPATTITTTTTTTTAATTTPTTATHAIANAATNSKAQVQRVVTAETAEPDTTTISSDCMKLADLLSSCDAKSNGNTFIFNGFSTLATNHEITGEPGGEKRVQQIQVQVNPSLTVVANGLVQAASIQQPGQTGSAGSNSAGGATCAGQMACRPTVVATTAASGQTLKSIVSNGELKLNESVLSNWSLQAANINSATNSTNSSSSGSSSSTTTSTTNTTLNSNNNNGAIGISGNNINNTTTTNQIGFSANGQTIGAHQIAIQVICQDGTSLVLPVSSAAGLNAAVSLTSQHQQLQAVLANNAAGQQRAVGNNQLLPLVSVSNIVAQQQVVTNSSSSQDQAGSAAQQSTSSSSSQPTGLAASSPTLAALLDAGSSRNSGATSSTSADFNATNGSLVGQGFVTTNLLRKLVNGSQGDPKQQSQQANLPAPGAMVTVCATPTSSANTSTSTGATNSTTAQQSLAKGASAEKKIKLETAIEAGAQKTTFTIIDPHNLIVTTAAPNSNQASESRQVASKHAINLLPGTDAQQQLQQQKFRPNCGSSTKPNQAELAKSSNKMSSSTGNRQVDPTQPFRCEHCNSTFTRLGNFTRHKKIHTVPTKDGQRFKCDVCSKSFLQRCDLARHLHIHRGTEPHRCNICGKGYIRHSDLVTHQRFHNKEKPFGCPHCSKGFCQRGDLNRHLRSIHLQMKPILCPCCNRKFAKQETLLRHLNTAHRSKSGSGNGSSVIADQQPNQTSLAQDDDKQANISQVTGAAVADTVKPISTEEIAKPVVNTSGDCGLNSSADDCAGNTTTGNVSDAVINDDNNSSNNRNATQKNPQVASLQAIQATLYKIPQPVDPSTTSSLCTIMQPDEDSSQTTRVVS